MRSNTLAQAASARWLFVAGAILFGAAAGPAWSSGAITGIDVAGKTDCVVITVQGDSALSFVPLVSPAGRYVGFQFPRPLALKGRVVAVRSGGIYNVRYSNFRSSPPIARIVVNTASHLDYATQWSPDRKRVEIHVMKKGAKPSAQTTARTRPVPATPAPAEKTAAPAPAEVAPPAEKAQAPDPPAGEKPAADRLSVYAAIAAKSRRPRVAVKVPTVNEPPAAQSLMASPGPSPVVPAADPPRAQDPVSSPQPTVTAGADRLSAYAAIAAKSRRPRVAAKATPSQDQPVAQAVAALPPSANVAAEPKVRVMGMVETSPAPPEGAGPSEPKPQSKPLLSSQEENQKIETFF